MSLTVELSLAQVAFITAETAPLLRRLFATNRPVLDLAERIERFLSARADTLEARMYAGEVVRAWEAFAATPTHREFATAHLKLRGIGKQDQVARRMRQLAMVLQSEPPKRLPKRLTRARSTAA